MFARLFKPKWQHPKPEVRVEAVKELATDDPALAAVAAEDGDVQVRITAIERLNDVQLLESLYRKESDSAVVEALTGRIATQLCDDNVNETQGGELVARLASAPLAEQVVRQSPSLHLRRAALSLISRQGLLGDIALSDSSPELRLEALERIERIATLERVAKEAKGKDKRLARRARERFQEAELEASRPRRQQEVCEALEQLNHKQSVDRRAAQQLYEEWTALQPALSSELADHFERQREVFERHYEEHRQEQARLARQRSICEALEQAVTQLLEDRDTTAAGHALEAHKHQWQELSEEIGEVNPGLAERFGDALEQLTRTIDEVGRERQRQEQLHELVQKADALLGRSGLREGEIERLRKQWPKPRPGEDSVLFGKLQQRFNGAIEQARQQVQRQRSELQALEGEVAELLEGFERSLDEGNTKAATSNQDRLRDRLKRLKQLGGAISGASERRLQRNQARYNELRDWRRFGTDQAREGLLEEMKALIGAEVSATKLAKEIKAVQEKWRALDRKDGLAPDELWQQFQALGQEAYAPCAAHQEEQERQREENVHTREQFLDQLAALERQCEAEQVDWAEIDHRLRKAQQRWSKLGGVNQSQWRALSKRYRQQCDALERALNPEREREQQRREGLIALVERQVEEEDLARAIEQTKNAQAQWKPTVPAKRSREQALWRRFRDACDAVFARQKELQNEQRAQRQAQRQQAEALCNELQQVLDDADSAGWEKAQGQADELRERWRSEGLERAGKGTSQRFSGLLRRFEQAHEQAHRQERRMQRSLLKEKAATIDALEQRLMGGESELTAAIEKYRALEPLEESDLEQALAQRLSRIEAITAGESAPHSLADEAEQNSELQQRLLLEMEILAEVESPAELADERLKLQVEMLADAMKGGIAAEQRKTAVGQRLRSFYLTGVVSLAHHSTVQKRLERILSYLEL